MLGFSLLALMAGALGGHWAFEPLLRRVCVGVFPQIVALSTDAQQVAHWSFTCSMAAFGVSIPIAARLAQVPSRKSSVAAHAVRALLVGALCFILAGLHYRHEMTKGWAFTREMFGIWGDTQLSLALNPLTRMALIATGGVIACELGRRIFPRR